MRNKYIQRRTFNSRRILGQCGKSGGSFVFHGMWGCIQKLKNASHISSLKLLQHIELKDTREAYTMRRINFAVQSDHFNNAHLQGFVQRPNCIVDANDILDGLWHWTMRKKHESISLAARIILRHKEGVHQLRRIWNEIFELAVYRI